MPPAEASSARGPVIPMIQRPIVLYEKFAHAEYEDDVREQERNFTEPPDHINQGTGKGFVTRLWQQKSSLPAEDATCPRGIALSPNGQLVVVTYKASATVLSQSDDFESSRGSFEDDDTSGLLKLAAWSPESEMLAMYSSKSGVVHIVDDSCQLVQSIPPPGSRRGEVVGLALRVCRPGSNSHSEADRKELIITDSQGNLERHPIAAAGSSELVPDHTSPKLVPLGRSHGGRVAGMAFHHDCSLLGLVGPPALGTSKAHPASMPSQVSVSLWRITDSPQEPCQMVCRICSPPPAGFGSFLRPFIRQPLVSIAPSKAVFSSGGGHLAVVTPSGRLEVFELSESEGQNPAISPLSLGSIQTEGGARRQENEQEDSPAFAVQGEEGEALATGSSAGDIDDLVQDCDWWGDQALIVARVSGSVSLEAVPGLENLLGNSGELFQPGPRVTRGGSGRIFVLEANPPEEESEESGQPSDSNKHAYGDMRLEPYLQEEEEQEDEQWGIWRLGLLAGWAKGLRRERGEGMRRPAATGWRLISLIQRSELEMMKVHLEAEEYGAALTLARTFGLDEDEVYKARWRASDGSKASIRDNLAKIKDRVWVMRECLGSLPRTQEAVMALLSYGLMETDKYKPLSAGVTSSDTALQEADGWDVSDEENEEGLEEEQDRADATTTEGEVEQPPGANDESQSKGSTLGAKEPSRLDAAEAAQAEEVLWYRRLRLRLLQFKDRLDTLVSLRRGRFSAEEFFSFRAQELREVALQFAGAGRVDMLSILMKHHPYSLYPHILEILDALPETAAPHSHKDLLPGLSFPPAVVFRRPDWVERLEFVKPEPLHRPELVSGKSALQASSAPKEESQVQGEPSIAVEEEKDSWPAVELGVPLLRCTEEAARLSSNGMHWPLPSQVSHWYQARAVAIDECCGQLENSVGLLTLGIARGIPGLASLCNDFMDLLSVVYGGGAGEGPLPGLTIGDWRQLSQQERFACLLQDVTRESALERIIDRVIPFLKRRDGQVALSEHPVVPGAPSGGTMPGSAQLAGTSAGPGSGTEEQSAPGESLLATWLEERARQTDLAVCGVVLGAAARGTKAGSLLFRKDLFSSIEEVIEAGLRCIYACPASDQWEAMADILASLRIAGGVPPATVQREDAKAKVGTLAELNERLRAGVGALAEAAMDERNLPQSLAGGLNLGRASQDLRRALKMSVKGRDPAPAQAEPSGQSGVEPSSNTPIASAQLAEAEGHVEAGRVLTLHQFPKSVSFFKQASVSDAKQALQQVLAAFSKQPHSDSEWNAMWRDACTIQSKAFPFLDRADLLAEFCRWLLSGAKFELAGSYLVGSPMTGGLRLPPHKAEQLVIRAAQEFFYSAPDVDSAAGLREVRRARECLALVIRDSPAARAEADLIQAVCETLPSLGVSIVPMELQQAPHRMKFVNMALVASPLASKDTMLELARQLGMSSASQQAAVQAAVAREAAARGDFQLSVQLCEDLMAVGHAPVWDLCAALARGPEDENTSLEKRANLLGFALAHCDTGSVTELLASWQQMEARIELDELARSVGVAPPSPGQTHTLLADFSGGEPAAKDPSTEEGRLVREGLAILAELSKHEEANEGRGLPQDVLATVALHLPWLLKASRDDVEKKDYAPGASSPSARALEAIFHMLATCQVAVSDSVLLQLAEKALAEGTRDQDVLALGYLLHVKEPQGEAEGLLWKEMQQRGEYAAATRAMLLGLCYAEVHTLFSGGASPAEVQELLETWPRSFSLTPRKEDDDGINKALDTSEGEAEGHWRQQKLAIQARLQASRDARALQAVLPEVDILRFLNGDRPYIESMVLSLVGPARQAQPGALQQALAVGAKYQVDRWQILMKHVDTLMRCDWPVEDIKAEVLQHEKELLTRPEEILQCLQGSLYPALPGTSHSLLSYFFSLLLDCYTVLQQQRKSSESREGPWLETARLVSLGADIGQNIALLKLFTAECAKISRSAPALDFKAVLQSDGGAVLDELHRHVTTGNVHSLAKMIKQLAAAATLRSQGLDASSNADASEGWTYPDPSAVFLALVRKQLGIDVDGALGISEEKSFEHLQEQYKICKEYFGRLRPSDLLDVLRSLLKMLARLSSAVSSAPLAPGTSSPLSTPSRLEQILGMGVETLDDVLGHLMSAGKEGYRTDEEWFGQALSCLAFSKQLTREGFLSGRDVAIMLKGLEPTGGDANAVHVLQLLVENGCPLRVVCSLDDVIHKKARNARLEFWKDPSTVRGSAKLEVPTSSPRLESSGELRQDPPSSGHTPAPPVVSQKSQTDQLRGSHPAEHAVTTASTTSAGQRLRSVGAGGRGKGGRGRGKLGVVRKSSVASSEEAPPVPAPLSQDAGLAVASANASAFARGSQQAGQWQSDQDAAQIGRPEPVMLPKQPGLAAAAALQDVVADSEGAGAVGNAEATVRLKKLWSAALQRSLDNSSSSDAVLQGVVGSLGVEVAAERRILLHNRGEDELQALRQDLRAMVWETLQEASQSPDVATLVRIQMLEFLQSLQASASDAGRDGASGGDGRVQKLHASKALWADWAPPSKRGELDAEQDPWGGSSAAGRTGAATTLLSLRSTEVIASLWPGVKVHPGELSSANGLEQFFLQLHASAISDAQSMALLRLLELWEGEVGAAEKHTEKVVMREMLSGRVAGGTGGAGQGAPAYKQAAKGSGWEWDDWDDKPSPRPSSLAEHQVPSSEETEITVQVSALHRCWVAILPTLMKAQGSRKALEALDRWARAPGWNPFAEERTSEGQTRSEKRSVVTRSEADDVLAALKEGTEFGTFSRAVEATKVALLLPYPDLHQQMLREIESQCSKATQREHLALDDDFLLLLLASSTLTRVAADDFQQLVHLLCMVVGPLAWELREYQTSKLKQNRGTAGIDPAEHRPSGDSGSVTHTSLPPLFRFAFPAFVAQLAVARQFSLPGSLVMQFQHVHPSLSVWNAAHTALRRYMEQQLRHFTSSQINWASVDDSKFDPPPGLLFPNAVRQICSGLPSLFASGLQAVIADGSSGAV